MPELWLNEYDELGDIARSLYKEEAKIINKEKFTKGLNLIWQSIEVLET
tara:strand:+ start:540 stop:686 length:147 start_codon:yes stop_codon:yes gene_type:complete